MPETRCHAEFPATRWSVILQVASPTSGAARLALEELCRAYWAPLYAYLRRSGHDPQMAQDTVQGFLARLLEREDLLNVAAEKGRFRSFLLAGLRNFLVSEARRAKAQKRGAGAAMISLDDEDAEATCRGVLAGDLPPDAAFDRRWAEVILEHSLEHLRREYAAKGRGDLFEALKFALAGDRAEDYAECGRRLGMTSGAVAVAVHRLRARLRELVRHEVAQTVSSHDMLEEEMRNLLAIFAG